MNAKMKAIKLNKLEKLVQASIAPIKEKYLRDISVAHKVVGADLPVNPFFGGCCYMSYLLHEVLMQHGFKAKLCGGMATFGINKTKNGAIEFGYNTEKATLNVHGELDFNTAFRGHVWVEIRGLDVIIDLTLLTLKEQFQMDNQFRGIVSVEENEYLLDPNKFIIAKPTLSRANIINGRVGYHYAKNAELFNIGMKNIERMLSDITVS